MHPDPKFARIILLLLAMAQFGCSNTHVRGTGGSSSDSHWEFVIDI